MAGAAAAAHQKQKGSTKKPKQKTGTPEITSLQEENTRLQAHNNTLQRANKKLESQISVHLLPFCRSREAAAKSSSDKLQAEQELTKNYKTQHDAAKQQLFQKDQELVTVQRYTCF